MKSEKLMNFIKSKDLVIPSILLINYKELKLSEKDLLFLSLLMSGENLISFDPAYFSKVLGWNVNEIIEVMSNLSNKKFINLVVKNENGKIKEFLDISYLYDKLALMIIDSYEETEEENSEIYGVIEKELGRTLSPIEYETISGWINAKISEELIKEALKEAVLNGVGNLKYIDKILYEWTKKGYKKASDVRKKKREPEKSVELFDYDWLDENE